MKSSFLLFAPFFRLVVLLSRATSFVLYLLLRFSSLPFPHRHRHRHRHRCCVVIN
jgi:hypothetical protein